MNKDEQTKILKACHVDATAGHMPWVLRKQ